MPTVGSDTIVGLGGTFRVNRAVVLCHPDTPLHPQPACFIARFPGVTSEPLDVMASGRVSETVLTTEAAVDQYDDTPIVGYKTTTGSLKLMLARESQSTGDDVFECVVQSGLQPTPATDPHRLEAIEFLLRRGSGYHPGTATITMTPIYSNILEAQAGTLGTAVAVPGLGDISQPVKAVVGTFTSGRFFGFKLVGDNINSLFGYLGALLRGRRLT